MNADSIVELVDEGLLAPLGREPHRWRFTGLHVRLQQLHVARPGAGHGIDDDDVGHVFKVMQRIEAAIAAIDDIGAGALHLLAQGERDGRAVTVIPVQGIAEAEDAEPDPVRH